MSESAWIPLGTFQADDMHSWQTFETGTGYWVRYLKIDLETNYVNDDTYFLTITQIKVLGSTVGQGMQQILQNTNKTKESLKATPKPEGVRNTSKSYGKFPPNLESIEIETTELSETVNIQEAMLNEFVNNGSDNWHSLEEMSIYESLIEQVTGNEKYLSLIFEMLRDLNKLIESLRIEISKLLIYVSDEKRDKDGDINELKIKLKKRNNVLDELRKTQSILEYNNQKQEFTIVIIFCLQLIVLLVLVVTCYYYKSISNKKQEKGTILLSSRTYSRITF